MTGLRERLHDPRLSVAAGDDALVPPRAEQVGAWARQHFLGSDGPRVVGVSLEYARWKPRTSLTCLYVLQLEDGTELTLGVKRYGSDKAARLAPRLARESADDRRAGRRRRFALLPDESLLLWLFPHDRVLSGIEPSLDPRWFARAVEATGLCPERSIRRRRLRSRILRYKPERRCVVRFDLDLRMRVAPLQHLVGRFHPPASLAAHLSTRLGFERSVGSGLVPDTLFTDAPRGLLVERWLDVEAAAPWDFEHAGEAGRILARVHAAPGENLGKTPGRTGTGALPSRVPADLAQLLSVDPRLDRLGAELPPALQDRAIAWTHGDVHADQFARGRGDGVWRLLDLDAVGVGDPMRDLASWIADDLHERPEIAPGEAGERILASYEPRAHLDVGRLHLLIAEELVLRAAASIRRLERGAVEIALRDLETAAVIREGGVL